MSGQMVLPPIPTATASSHEVSKSAALDLHDDRSSSSDDGSPNADVLSILNMCGHCQSMLSHAFDHCLANVCVPSVTQIDEQQDSVPRTEPPYFEIIDDPSVARNKLYKDPALQAAKQRAVLQRGRQDEFAVKGQAHPHLVSGKKIDVHFSGTLYKYSLQDKTKKIEKLRGEVFEKTKANELETRNCNMLQKALKQSKIFYINAEDWQKKEASRLQEDIKCMKAEFSLLLAYIVRSEEEKRELLGEIAMMEKSLVDKSYIIKSLRKNTEEVKTKLQDTFKEYLQLNETIARLKEEAERGNDIMGKKNDILQKNLDKMSRDFELTSRELATYQAKSKDLDFELEEMIHQFNNMGDEKKRIEEQYANLMSEFQRLAQSFSELKATNDLTNTKNKSLLAELQEHANKYSNYKFQTDMKIAHLEKQIEELRGINNMHEVNHKFSTSEIDRLKKSLESVTRVKDTLDKDLKEQGAKYTKDIGLRETTIKTHQEQLDLERAKLKKVTEQREQLLFQVTDLRNSLERETGAIDVLKFESGQASKAFAEKQQLYEETIEKLNGIKQNLNADKRQLAERLRVTRSDLTAKEDEVKQLEEKFAAHRTESANKIAELTRACASAREGLGKVERHRDDLQGKLNREIASHESLKTLHKSLGDEHAALHELKNAVDLEVAKFARLSEELQGDKDALIAEKTDLISRLDTLTRKVNDTSTSIDQMRQDYEATIKEKDTLISKLSAELSTSREDRSRLEILCKRLKARNTFIEEELKQVSSKLLLETVAKETLETNADMLRQSLHVERKARIEFERLHARIDRKQLESELERVLSMQKRDQKLQHVSEKLVQELDRIDEITRGIGDDSI